MAANNARAVASALPVANVQALAEACNGIDGQVPERYLVAEAEVGSEEIVAAGGGGSHSEIPVVDLRKLLDTRSSEECAKLKSACHHWGFFQVVHIINSFVGSCAVSILQNGRACIRRATDEPAAVHAHTNRTQLINHGVPDEVIGNLMRDVAEFFDLPLEAKKEWAQRPDSVQGYGQAFVVSEDQKLDWADMLHLQLQPSESRDLRVWPTRPHSFR